MLSHEQVERPHGVLAAHTVEIDRSSRELWLIDSSKGLTDGSGALYQVYVAGDMPTPFNNVHDAYRAFLLLYEALTGGGVPFNRHTTVNAKWAIKQKEATVRSAEGPFSTWAVRAVGLERYHQIYDLSLHELPKLVQVIRQANGA